MSPTGLTLAAARDALRRRAIGARELADAHLEAIDRLDGTLNSFITVTPELAREAADRADAALGRGEHGPLTGLPIAIKDLFCTEGVRTTAASRMLREFVPPYSSTITARLLADGAVFLGKTNLDEFAMGSSNMNSAFGPVTNPWRRRGANEEATASSGFTRLVPGGSSGGSAAAVAARLALAATATDTGGSIRQPASFCGIAGIKPTYGRCSRFGIVAFASSLDQAGPLARTVEDCAILLGSMAGHDERDSTSADLPVPDFAAACRRTVRGLRIGIPREYRLAGMPDDVERLWSDGVEWLREAGATIVDVSLPHTRHGLATYYIVAPAECSSNLARYDGVRFTMREPGEDLATLYANTRAGGFGPEVKRRILIGTHVLSSGYYDAYYLRAQKVRALILRDFNDVFRDVDALLTPTAPTAAFAQGEKMDDPLTMYLNDVFTVPASMAGVPALSVPAGLDAQGLPLGLQVIGRPFDEETIITVGQAIERAASFDAVPDLHA